MTSCTIKMVMEDVTAKADSTFLGDSTSFSDMEKLVIDHEELEYASWDKNAFALDGSKLVGTPDVAYWSSVKSNDSCEINQSIDVAFTELHSSSGITLEFVDCYPTKMEIYWMASDGEVITSEAFNPNKLNYYAQKQVENYKGLRIIFKETAHAGERIRLKSIQYGTTLLWADDRIISGSINESIDVTSSVLEINTAQITIEDVANDFNIESENGAWKSVQKTQEVTITENVDGQIIPCGTFFIDEFDFSGDEATFSMVDPIGLMDRYTFYDGEVYTNRPVASILTKIFETAGISKYSVADDIASIELTGYLGIMSCRQALQMVCFACGAVADDSRSDTIRVYVPDRYISSSIATSRKFSGETVVKLDEYVSGISIGYNIYKPGENSTAYEGYVYEGDNLIEFAKPFDPLTIRVSAGTLIDAHTNYAIVRAATATAITITGDSYESYANSFSMNVEEMKAGESANVKQYDGITLYNSALMLDLAVRLMEYWDLQKTISFKYILEHEQVGNWANIQSVNGDNSYTLIEEQSIDLTGGFLSLAKARGYSKVVTSWNYTGELYTGEEIGV